MPRIENTITINRNVVDVFRAATDYNSLHTWQKGVKKVDIISGEPIRPGTMISILRGSLFINADVLEFQRNKIVTLQGIWGRFRFHWTQEYQSAARETVIRDVLNIQTGWLYFWYAPILSSSVRSQLRADRAALKKQLENS